MAKRQAAQRLLHAAPTWTSPRSRTIVLWHGCLDSDLKNIEQNGINLAHCRVNTDFGRGFYTTTTRRQAEFWALFQFQKQRSKLPNAIPVILRFAISRWRLARLDTLAFVRGEYANVDFWSLVQHCRASTPQQIFDHDGPRSGWYDLVVGPVAAMWQQRVSMLDSDQFSFHTDRAVALLNGCIKSNDQRRFHWDPV